MAEAPSGYGKARVSGRDVVHATLFEEFFDAHRTLCGAGGNFLTPPSLAATADPVNCKLCLSKKGGPIG